MSLRPISMLAGVVAAAPALAADPPHRKTGLWEVRTSDGSYGGMFHYCTDAANEETTLMIFPVLPEQCTNIDAQRSDDTVIIDAACTKNGKTTTAHAVVTGNFDSAHTMTLTLQDVDLPGGKSTTTFAAKWLGPCAADQKPGDYINPATGAKVNIPAMARAKSPPL